MSTIDPSIAVVLSRLDSLTYDVGEVRTAIKEMAAAIGRLAVIEERQSTTNEAIARAFKEIGHVNIRITEVDAEVKTRLAAIERDQPIQRQSSDMVQTALKYLVALALGAILAGVIRMPGAPTQTPPAITSK